MTDEQKKNIKTKTKKTNRIRKTIPMESMIHFIFAKNRRRSKKKVNQRLSYGRTYFAVFIPIKCENDNCVME